MEASILYTNDLHLAYFTLVTVYCLFLWEKHQEPRYIVLTGIFAGLCFSTKYIALTYVPFLSITGIIIGAWQESKSHIFKTIVLCSLPAIVVFIPWLIKNFLFTGNPLYPAFYSILAGNDMTLEQFGHL
jgi:4-amino-4-deoxy-L-arabinose transferase-like glycosyltransferase